MKNAAIVFIYAIVILICAAISGCGSHNEEGKLPDKFTQLPDSAKMNYFIKRISPDSLARLLCMSSLKRNNIPIEDLRESVRYVYMSYSKENRVNFSNALDCYMATLSPRERFTLYKNASGDNPYKLGYRLGMDYAKQLDEGSLTPAQLAEEYGILIQLYREDTIALSKLSKGMKTALGDKPHSMVISE